MKPFCDLTASNIARIPSLVVAESVYCVTSRFFFVATALKSESTNLAQSALLKTFSNPSLIPSRSKGFCGDS